MMSNLLDKRNMNLFLEGDQQLEMNGNNVPRIKNNVFKPFKIIRDFIRPPEKERALERKRNTNHMSLYQNECNNF